MDAIRHAISPEQLDLVRSVFRAEETSEQRAGRLCDAIRRKRDEQAERDDRNRHERRRAAALERRDG